MSQISLVQQRSRGEQTKLDIFQESRDFVDQFVRDAHETGYPSAHMFDTSSWTVAPASPIYTDTRLAAGITLIGPSEIKFEGDVEGDGNVDVVDYKLAPTGNNCPCLQRSAVDKTSGTSCFFKRGAERAERRHHRGSHFRGVTPRRGLLLHPPT